MKAPPDEDLATSTNDNNSGATAPSPSGCIADSPVGNSNINEKMQTICCQLVDIWGTHMKTFEKLKEEKSSVQPPIEDFVKQMTAIFYTANNIVENGKLQLPAQRLTKPSFMSPRSCKLGNLLSAVVPSPKASDSTPTAAAAVNNPKLHVETSKLSSLFQKRTKEIQESAKKAPDQQEPPNKLSALFLQRSRDLAGGGPPPAAEQSANEQPETTKPSSVPATNVQPKTAAKSHEPSKALSNLFAGRSAAALMPRPPPTVMPEPPSTSAIPETELEFDYSPEPPVDLVPKALQWNAINPKRVTNTIWAELLTADVKQRPPAAEVLPLECCGSSDSSASGKKPDKHRWQFRFVPDYNLLNDGFFESSAKKQQSMERKAALAAAAADAAKKRYVSVLPPKKSQNIEIALKGLNLLNDATPVINAVMNLDIVAPNSGDASVSSPLSSATTNGETGSVDQVAPSSRRITGETIELIQQLFPTPEEETCLRKLETETAPNCEDRPIAPADKFALQLLKYPRFKERAKCVTILLSWNSDVVSVRSKLTTLIDGVCVIVDSLKFGVLRVLLLLVLQMGNYVNYRTKRKCAPGLMVSTLESLRSTKTVDSSSTFFRIMAKTIQSQSPDQGNLVWQSLKPLAEMEDLWETNPDDIEVLMKGMESRLQHIQSELSKQKDIQFQNVFTVFVERASENSQTLKELLNKAKDSLTDLNNILGENKKVNRERLEIVKKLTKFACDVRKAHQDNNTAAAAEIAKKKPPQPVRKSLPATTNASATNANLISRSKTSSASGAALVNRSQPSQQQQQRPSTGVEPSKPRPVPTLKSCHPSGNISVAKSQDILDCIDVSPTVIDVSTSPQRKPRLVPTKNKVTSPLSSNFKRQEDESRITSSVGGHRDRSSFHQRRECISSNPTEVLHSRDSPTEVSPQLMTRRPTPRTLEKPLTSSSASARYFEQEGTHGHRKMQSACLKDHSKRNSRSPMFGGQFMDFEDTLFNDSHAASRYLDHEEPMLTPKMTARCRMAEPSSRTTPSARDHCNDILLAGNSTRLYTGGVQKIPASSYSAQMFMGREQHGYPQQQYVRDMTHVPDGGYNTMQQSITSPEYHSTHVGSSSSGGGYHHHHFHQSSSKQKTTSSNPNMSSSSASATGMHSRRFR